MSSDPEAGTVILVAEDNAMIALAIEMDLEDAGFEVLGPVATRPEAERLARERPPALALVDVDLAHGDSGLDLAATLSNELSVPCLFVTGQALDAQRNANLALGVLRKPFTGSDLIGAVQTALGPERPVASSSDEGRVVWFGAG